MELGRVNTQRRWGFAVVVMGYGLLLPFTSYGDVVNATKEGFSLRFEKTFNRPASAVYRTIINLESWWDPAHTFSGDAGNLKLDLKPGGCLCEYWEGGAVQHLTVGYVEENSTLRLLGALGPLQQMAVAGSMSFVVTPVDSGSRLVFTYEVGGYWKDGLASLAAPVDGVWAGHLARLDAAVAALAL